MSSNPDAPDTPAAPAAPVAPPGAVADGMPVPPEQLASWVQGVQSLLSQLSSLPHGQGGGGGLSPPVAAAATAAATSSAQVGTDEAVAASAPGLEALRSQAAALMQMSSQLGLATPAQVQATLTQTQTPAQMQVVTAVASDASKQDALAVVPTTARDASGERRVVGPTEEEKHGDRTRDKEQRSHSRRSRREREAVDAHIDLAVMYSNPVVMSTAQGDVVAIDLLSQADEQRLIQDSLKESRVKVRMRVYPATTDQFRVMLTNGCTALHFSGHGLSDQQNRDILVFEDVTCCAHMVDSAMLARLLGAGIEKLKLVFVAACNSLVMGRVFQMAGVPYVVCVHREVQVMDRAAITFSRAFYHALLAGQSVEDAFQMGQARVSSESGLPHSESYKFALLRGFDPSALTMMPHVPMGGASLLPSSLGGGGGGAVVPAAAAHIFGKLSTGRWMDLTPKCKYRRLPARSHMFVGRNVDIHRLMKLLCKQRLVTIRGPPGMGKTSLAKALSHYVLKRRVFTDGVLFCGLRGCDTARAIFSTISKQLQALVHEDGHHHRDRDRDRDKDRDKDKHKDKDSRSRHGRSRSHDGAGTGDASDRLSSRRGSAGGKTTPTSTDPKLRDDGKASSSSSSVGPAVPLQTLSDVTEESSDTGFDSEQPVDHRMARLTAGGVTDHIVATAALDASTDGADSTADSASEGNATPRRARSSAHSTTTPERRERKDSPHKGLPEAQPEPPQTDDPRTDVLRALGDRRILLVWDNCEDAIAAGSAVFRGVLHSVLENVPNCSIVLTSRVAVGGGVLDVAEKVYSLQPLEPLDAARLFERFSPRPVTLEELAVQNDPDGDRDDTHGSFGYSGSGSGSGSSSSSSDSEHDSPHSPPARRDNSKHSETAKAKVYPKDTEAARRERRRRKEDKKKKKKKQNKTLGSADNGTGGGGGGGSAASETQVALYQGQHDGHRHEMPVPIPSVSEGLYALARHPVLRFLGGHPQAISLAAPLLQDRSLADLQRLLSTKSLDALELVGSAGDEKAHLNTLVASLEVSMDHVRKQKKEAADLFCLMALLPVGGASSDFAELWGPDWEDLMMLLIRASLVVRSEFRLKHSVREKFHTFPFMVKYAEKLLLSSGNMELCKRLVEQCRIHFANVTEELLQSVGTSTVGSSDAYDLLELYEDNMWAALRTWPGDVKKKQSSALRFMGPQISPIGRLASTFSSLLFFAGRPQQCNRAASKGLAAAKAMKDQLAQANLRKVLAVLYARNPKTLEKAKKYLGTALILYKGVSSILGQGLTLNCLGYVHAKLQNFHGARNCYERSIHYFVRLSHWTAVLNCYRWLGTICLKLPGEKERAMEYYDLSRRMQTYMASRRRSLMTNRWNGSDLTVHLQIPTQYMDHMGGPSTIPPQFLPTGQRHSAHVGAAAGAFVGGRSASFSTTPWQNKDKEKEKEKEREREKDKEAHISRKHSLPSSSVSKSSSAAALNSSNANASAAEAILRRKLMARSRTFNALDRRLRVLNNSGGLSQALLAELDAAAQQNQQQRWKVNSGGSFPFFMTQQVLSPSSSSAGSTASWSRSSMSSLSPRSTVSSVDDLRLLQSELVPPTVDELELEHDFEAGEEEEEEDAEEAEDGEEEEHAAENEEDEEEEEKKGDAKPTPEPDPEVAARRAAMRAAQRVREMRARRSSEAKEAERESKDSKQHGKGSSSSSSSSSSSRLTLSGVTSAASASPVRSSAKKAKGPSLASVVRHRREVAQKTDQRRKAEAAAGAHANAQANERNAGAETSPKPAATAAAAAAKLSSPGKRRTKSVDSWDPDRYTTPPPSSLHGKSTTSPTRKASSTFSFSASSSKATHDHSSTSSGTSAANTTSGTGGTGAAGAVASPSPSRPAHRKSVSSASATNTPLHSTFPPPSNAAALTVGMHAQQAQAQAQATAAVDNSPSRTPRSPRKELPPSRIPQLRRSTSKTHSTSNKTLTPRGSSPVPSAAASVLAASATPVEQQQKKKPEQEKQEEQDQEEEEQDAGSGQYDSRVEVDQPPVIKQAWQGQESKEEA